jgi:hypothetical protein
MAVRILDSTIPQVGNQFSPDAPAEFASARKSLGFSIKEPTGPFRMVPLESPRTVLGQNMVFFPCHFHHLLSL